MQESSRFLGPHLYKKLREVFAKCINSYRSEKSSGNSGLKKAAKKVWKLGALEDEDNDVYQEKLADLLKGKFYPF